MNTLKTACFISNTSGRHSVASRVGQACWLLYGSDGKRLCQLVPKTSDRQKAVWGFDALRCRHPRKRVMFFSPYLYIARAGLVFRPGPHL